MNDKVNIWDLIRRRFPATEYALLREVRDAAGFQASRAADGVAMNLWPSRGLEINGIELKSFRGDWLNERKKPHKAEAIFKYCDRFWLIAENDKIVLKEEVPVTWGLMVANGKGLKTIIEAPKLTPQDLDRHFVAAMLKRATNGLIHPSSIESKIAEAVEKGKDYYKSENERLVKRNKELEKVINDFEEASGIFINHWSGKSEKIGKTVRFILNGGGSTVKNELDDLKSKSEKITFEISKILNELSTQLTIPGE